MSDQSERENQKQDAVDGMTELSDRELQMVDGGGWLWGIVERYMRFASVQVEAVY